MFSQDETLRANRVMVGASRGRPSAVRTLVRDCEDNLAASSTIVRPSRKESWREKGYRFMTFYFYLLSLECPLSSSICPDCKQRRHERDLLEHAL